MACEIGFLIWAHPRWQLLFGCSCLTCQQVEIPLQPPFCNSWTALFTSRHYVCVFLYLMVQVGYTTDFDFCGVCNIRLRSSVSYIIKTSTSLYNMYSWCLSGISKFHGNPKTNLYHLKRGTQRTFSKNWIKSKHSCLTEQMSKFTSNDLWPGIKEILWPTSGVNRR